MPVMPIWMYPDKSKTNYVEYLDPKTGKYERTEEGTCNDCGEELQGKFCVNCECHEHECNCDEADKVIVWPRHLEPETENKTQGKEHSLMTLSNALTNANKQAGTQAAKVRAGKILVRKLTKVLKAQAPKSVGPYLEHPLAGIVLANLVYAAAFNYLPDNERLKIVAQAMLDGAAGEFLDQFDIEGMLDGFLEGVNLGALGLPYPGASTPAPKKAPTKKNSKKAVSA